MRSRARLPILCELDPRELLSRAQEEWSIPEFLEPNNINARQVSSVYDLLQPVMHGLQLNGHWSSGRRFDRVLYGSDTHDPGVSEFLLSRVDLVPHQVEIEALCYRFR